MIPSIVRGKVYPELEVRIMNYLTRFETRKVKQIRYPKDIQRLSKTFHDIVLDVPGPTLWLIFLKFEDDKPLTVVLKQKEKECVKLDLGPGLHKDLFDGTVLEVKWQGNTFHLIDVLFYKGAEVKDRVLTVNQLEADVIPFVDRPKLFSYKDIPSLTQHRILFLPPQAQMASWLFVPNTLVTPRHQLRTPFP